MNIRSHVGLLRNLAAATIAVSAVYLGPHQYVRADTVARSESEITAPDIGGTVKTADGQPCVGARITWMESTEDKASPLVVTSDKDGNFLIPGKKAWTSNFRSGSVLVEAKGFGLTGTMVMGRVRPIYLIPPPATDLHVRFVDGAGKPVVGIHVRPENLHNASHNLNIFKTGTHLLTYKTDKDGTVVIPNLPQGWVAQLQVNESAYVPLDYTTGSCQLSEAPVSAGLTITLTEGVTIEGKIRFGDSGKPVPGIKVSAQSRSAQPGRGSYTTNSDGTYRISRLPPGDYDVFSPLTQKLDQDWATHNGHVVVASGGTKTYTADLTLIKGALLTGTVTGEDGKPASGLSINVLSQSDRYYYQQSLTDAEGKYHVRMPGGTVVVTVGIDQTQHTVDLKDDETKVLDLVATAASHI